MKIYHTITLRTMLGVLLTTLFFTGMVIFVSEESITAIFNTQFLTIFLSSAIIIFYTVFGDAAFLKFSDEQPGYKYFRSIPHAYERFYKHCITLDAVYLIIGFALLVPVVMSGFRGTLNVIAFTAYMLIFAVYHLANAFGRVNTNAYMIIKCAMGGVIGMTSVMGGLLLSDFSLTKIPANTGIILVIISAVLAAASACVLYPKFRKKWNED